MTYKVNIFLLLLNFRLLTSAQFKDDLETTFVINMALKKITVLLILILPLFTASQNIKISQEDKDIALHLKAKYSDDHAVILNSLTEITFEKDTNGKVFASEKTTEEIMSLRVNLEFSRDFFYDSYSKITERSFLNHKGKKLYPYSICGNYEENNIFHSDVKFCIYPFKVSSIGEKRTVKIKKKYIDLKYLTKIYFATNLPIENKQILFHIPSWLNVELLDFNLQGFNVSKKASNNEEQEVIEYKAKELNSIKKEDNSLGLSSWQPHLLILSKGITLPNSNQHLISNLDERYKWYKTLVDSLNRKNTTIEALVKSVLSNEMTDIEKVESIFYWVQDNIRYIAYEEGIAAFKPDEAHTVLEKKYGDCKSMANLTKVMLQVAGFDARLTWLGTNAISYNHSIPSLSVDNHMICTVFFDGKKYFLDATEKFISINDYAERIQGRPVLIENKTEYILDTIPTFSPKRNIIIRDINFKLAENQLTGTLNTEYNGEKKITTFRYLKSQQRINEDELLEELLKNDNHNIEIQSLSHSGLFKRVNPFKTSSELSYKNSITSIENQLYIDLDPYKDFNFSSIDEDRLSNFYLGEKVNLKTEILFDLPEGYHIEHIPQNLKISTNSYTVLASYTSSDTSIKYSKEFIFKNNQIMFEEFEVWNKTLSQIKRFYSDQIILEKNN